MKKTACGLILLLFVLAAVPANADDGLCGLVGRLAMEVMERRQDGTDRETVDAAVSEAEPEVAEVLEQMVDVAWTVPLAGDPGEKTAVSAGFGQMWLDMCEGFGQDDLNRETVQDFEPGS